MQLAALPHRSLVLDAACLPVPLAPAVAAAACEAPPQAAACVCKRQVGLAQAAVAVLLATHPLPAASTALLAVLAALLAAALEGRFRLIAALAAQAIWHCCPPAVALIWQLQQSPQRPTATATASRRSIGSTSTTAAT